MRVNIQHIFSMYQYQFSKWAKPTAVLFALAIFSMQAHSVYAAISYTVSPMVIDIESEARDIVSKSIILTNTGTQQVTVYPSVNNISVTDGGTIDTFLPPVESDRTQSLASWVEISRQGIDLQPGEVHTISITIRINPAPVAGTYHAFIGFGYGGNRDEAEAQVRNGQAPGMVLSVTIADKKLSLLKLSKFIIDTFVTDKNNQSAVFSFNNPGEEALTPTGEIIFYDNTGQEVASVPVNQEKISIPPGEDHVFTVHVPTEGNFGKHKAYLNVSYGTKQRATIQDTNFFYIIPLIPMLIIIFTTLFVVGFGAWYFHKKYLPPETFEDGERLFVHVREGVSDTKHHDIDLKKIP